MLMLAPNNQAIRAVVEEALSEVEATFTAELSSDLSCVNQLVEHIEGYRGKMLRPMLVVASGLASASAQPPLRREHVMTATIVEMVHMATLVHDDVLDDASTRRGGYTVNQLRGNETAVMLGDYLISHSYHLCAKLERIDVGQMISKTTNIVCEGELLQLANRNNWNLDEKTYFDIVRRKTASLCGVCCRLGAHLNEASPEVISQLNQYGEHVGVAFQIVDDLLDLTGDEQVVGKSLGRDLAKGKLTLPVIHSLSTLGSEDRQSMLSLIEKAALDGSPERFTAKLVNLLKTAGSLEFARKMADQRINEARKCLAILPDSPAKTLLHELAGVTVTRNA